MTTLSPPLSPTKSKHLSTAYLWVTFKIGEKLYRRRFKVYQRFDNFSLRAPIVIRLKNSQTIIKHSRGGQHVRHDQIYLREINSLDDVEDEVESSMRLKYPLSTIHFRWENITNIIIGKLNLKRIGHRVMLMSNVRSTKN